jgi:hypothetical protein
MKDLNINIGGPRDRARQQVALHVQQGGDRPGLSVDQFGQLLQELRSLVQQCQLPADDVRRVERHLKALEEESHAPQPLLDEIQSSLSAVGRLLQSGSTLAPAALMSLKALAASMGLTFGT